MGKGSSQLSISPSTRKRLLWAGVLGALLASVYCLLGIVQLGSYSAGPNYPRDLALERFKLWLAGMLLFLALAGVFLIMLWRARKKSD